MRQPVYYSHKAGGFNYSIFYENLFNLAKQKADNQNDKHQRRDFYI